MSSKIASVSSVGNDTPSNLTFAALETMLSHGSDYLSICDLGSLTSTSETVGSLIDESVAWKRVFDKAASAGKVCHPEYLSGSLHKNHAKQTWNGEPGLLECFSNPQVLARVGYRQAAKCILSKQCTLCNKMAATANPLLLARMCEGCSEKDEASWIIGKSKAKEAFLLSEKECNALASASIPFVMSNKPDAKQATSVMLLMSDVVAASNAKHGGPNGLATEIAKRKAAAAARYEKSQSTDKPQKKRPKIEKLPDRPGDDLASLRYFFGTSALPIPTRTSSFDCGTMNMTHSTKCQVKECGARGTVADIVNHELMQHGMHSSAHEPEAHPPFEGVSLSIPTAIQPADELVQLFVNADIQYEFDSRDEFMPYENQVKIGSTEKSIVSFAFGDSRVVVDCDMYIGTEIDINSVRILFQKGNCTVPVQLVVCNKGEGIGEYPLDEATLKAFENVKLALGLKETTSSQLVAAILARALGADEFLGQLCQEDPEADEYPVIHGAWTLLKACEESNEE